jgi:quercetin dioxygenase-like cupin family protein
MRSSTKSFRTRTALGPITLSIAIGVAIASVGNQALGDHRGPHYGTGSAAGTPSENQQAEALPPTEHKGLEVTTLGVIPATSMEQQLGLAGHKLQLRAITILPGGQIAKHSHESRPGLVKVISGTWTEGRPGEERTYAAEDPDTILEDERTEHWFWNRGDTPATALVCDIVADD